MELASFLDDWAVERHKARGGKDDPSWRQLMVAAMAADPDPWRLRLRDAIGRDDQGMLRRLGGDEKGLEAQAAVSLVLLARALLTQGDRAQAERVLHRAWRAGPGDFWVNFTLGMVRWTGNAYNDPRGAERFLTAAVAIRPRSPFAHHNLGVALLHQGKQDEAIAEFRNAIRLKPDYAEAHTNLGNALSDQGKVDEAIAEYRTAIRLKPDYAGTHHNLGNALRDQGKLDEAIAESRTAIRLNPDLAKAHSALGVALSDQGKQDEAIAEYRTAIRLEPDYAEAHYNLGAALGAQGKQDEAIAEYRTAIRLKPDYVEAHHNLGAELSAQGKLDEAIAEYKAVIRLKPDSPFPHNNLANHLRDQGKQDEAIAEYRTAIRLKPDYADGHYNLGLALRSQGDFTEAIVELRRARDLAKTNPSLAQKVERDLVRTERQTSLAARLPAVLAGRDKPAGAVEMLGFADLCYFKQLQVASARFYVKAFQTQPKLADDVQAQNRYNAACAAALAGCGQCKDEPAPDEAAKAQWRKQALEWLKADVSFWTKQVDNGPSQARQFVAQTFQHWKADTDLAGIREETALAKLPPDEQKACRVLWGEVDATLRKAQSR